MDPTGARKAGKSLGLRTLAAFVLAVLFGLQLAPLAQAQATRTPDCCMAAEGRGCSMHLHRAAQSAAQSGHTAAALQPPCPCPAVAPASVIAHDALSLSASHLAPAPFYERAAQVPSRGMRVDQVAGSGGTRGPPALTLAA